MQVHVINGLPSDGFKLVISDGDKCEVNGHPRLTTLTFPCDPSKDMKDDFTGLLEAYEGSKNDLCHYYVTFPASKLGCPIYSHRSLLDSAHPLIITAGQYMSLCVLYSSTI